MAMKIILHCQFISDNVGVSSLPQRKIRNMIRDHLNHWKANALLLYKWEKCHWCLCWKSCINAQSLCTSSTVKALYIETRIPPTDLCPLRETIPSLEASSTNCFSKMSSPSAPPIRKTAFIRLRQWVSTGALKTKWTIAKLSFCRCPNLSYVILDRRGNLPSEQKGDSCPIVG